MDCLHRCLNIMSALPMAFFDYNRDFPFNYNHTVY